MARGVEKRKRREKTGVNRRGTRVERERERELRDKRRTTYKFNKSLVTIPLAETNNPLVRRVSTRSWRKKHEDIRDTLVIVSRFSRLDIARNYVLKYIYIEHRPGIIAANAPCVTRVKNFFTPYTKS